MQRSIKIGLFLFSIIVASASSYKIYDEFILKYKNIENIYIEFISESLNKKGSIKAKKGNKFIIKFSDRILISDGENIWNYSPFEKQVIISPFQDFENEFSLESFFFNNINDLKPISISEKNSTAYGKYTLVELKDSLKTKSVDLEFLSNNKLSRLIYNDEFISESWQIIKIDPKVMYDDDIFHFSPPDSIEVIDLRF